MPTRVLPTRSGVRAATPFVKARRCCSHARPTSAARPAFTPTKSASRLRQSAPERKNRQTAGGRPWQHLQITQRGARMNTYTIDIGAPPATVFKWIHEAPRNKLWLPNLAEAEVLHSEPGGVGSTFRQLYVENGRRIEM